MRWPAVAGTVALTELAAYFLSLTWGLMILLAAFAWIAMSGATVAAKARSTESRLNAHVAATAPAVNLVANGGTIGGTVVVNGDHHIVGTLWGNGGTLPVGDSIQANSNLTVNGVGRIVGNAYTDGGLTVNNSMTIASGGATVNGGFTSNNGGTVNGNFNAAGGITGPGGSSLTIPAGANVGNIFNVGGQRIAPGQGTPGGYPIGHGTPWEDQVIDNINAIITSLRGAGIFA